MYYPDLSPFIYGHHSLERVHALNVGWLSSEHEFQTAATDPSFLRALRPYCLHPVVMHRGFHACEFCCPSNGSQPLANQDGSTTKLGSKLVVIFGSDTTAYVSPDLIFHYVSEHDYAPPEEFVKAVFSGPQPGSRDYAKLVREHMDGFAVDV